MGEELSRNPIHLGLGATAVREPELTGMEWYGGYSERHASDGAEGRLVSMHTFSAPWDAWEMHPHGSEVVVCTAGAMTLVQEIDGEEVRTQLAPGEYAINAPGVWHTADVEHSYLFRGALPPCRSRVLRYALSRRFAGLFDPRIRATPSGATRRGSLCSRLVSDRTRTAGGANSYEHSATALFITAGAETQHRPRKR